MRDADDALYRDLIDRQEQWQDNGVLQVTRIGDAYAPGTIAAAVYAGHKAARGLDEDLPGLDEVPFRREMMALGRA